MDRSILCPLEYNLDNDCGENYTFNDECCQTLLFARQVAVEGVVVAGRLEVAASSR